MSAMLVAPAAAARQWVKTLGGMVLLSAAMGVLAGVSGGVISVLTQDAATGPVIVLCAGGIVLFSLLFAPQRGVIGKLRLRRDAGRMLQRRQILLDFLKLAQKHDNPHYPVERGMINALYNANHIERSLQPLIKAGELRPTHHMTAFEGTHWQLTQKGYQRALAIVSASGGNETEKK